MVDTAGVKVMKTAQALALKHLSLYKSLHVVVVWGYSMESLGPPQIPCNNVSKDVFKIYL